MIQHVAGSLREDEMNHWIQEHPYLFFIGYVYTIISINHAVIKFASYKYDNKRDDQRYI